MIRSIPIDEWSDVTKDAACEICGKPDWCTRANDVAHCRRKDEAPAGWSVLKRTPGGGTVFKTVETNGVTNARRSASMNGKTKDWGALSSECARNLSEKELEILAKELGVSQVALKSIDLGWHKKKHAYVFPERNHASEVIGIATRYKKGAKGFLKGGRRGLTLPSNWREGDGPLLIVEGPSDVAAAISLGLRAIGRPSANGGFEHLRQLLADEAFMIVGENDEKPDGTWPGRDGARGLAQQLAQAFETRVHYALPPSGYKDLRDFVAHKAPASDDAEASAELGSEFLRAITQSVKQINPTADFGAGCWPYLETPDGIVWDKPSREGAISTQLTNFLARIVSEVQHDDGTESRLSFRMKAQLANRDVEFDVAGDRFAGMSWAVEFMGAGAIIFPGFSTKDHARTAIQLLSGKKIPRATFYTHTGWREHDGSWFYMHQDGAIGANGLDTTIHTDLPAPLSRFALPAPPPQDELVACIKHELELLKRLPPAIVFPLVGATFRSVLGPSDFSIFLVGPSGCFKTELAALMMQHFGADFDARNLPGSWSSTANQNEMLAFCAKDALLVVDDFAPGGSSHDVSRFHRDADRLLRAQGNRAGRGRLRSDGTLRPVKPPRGLILSTGEDIPRGHSLRARSLIIEVAANDVAATALTTCQTDARNGVYSKVMAGFLQWLASDTNPWRRELQSRVTERRDQVAETTSHRRTPALIADVLIGFEAFLEFAYSTGALDDPHRDEFLGLAIKTLQGTVAKQQSFQTSADPVRRFFDLLRSVLVSGQAHVAKPDGGTPEQKPIDVLGWRAAYGSGSDLTPRGDLIGYVSDEELWLLPMPAYRAIKRYSEGTDELLCLGSNMLWKRIAERGLLAEIDSDGHHVIKKQIGGGRRRVLVFPLSVLLSDESGQSGQSADEDSYAPETG